MGIAPEDAFLVLLITLSATTSSRPSMRSSRTTANRAEAVPAEWREAVRGRVHHLQGVAGRRAYTARAEKPAAFPTNASR